MLPQGGIVVVKSRGVFRRRPCGRRLVPKPVQLLPGTCCFSLNRPFYVFSTFPWRFIFRRRSLYVSVSLDLLPHFSTFIGRDPVDPTMDSGSAARGNNAEKGSGEEDKASSKLLCRWLSTMYREELYHILKLTAPMVSAGCRGNCCSCRFPVSAAPPSGAAQSKSPATVL